MPPSRCKRVVLDCRWVRMDSGIGQYAYWLARSLPAIATDLDFELWLPRRDDPLVSDLSRRWGDAHQVRIPGNAARLGSSLLGTLQLLMRGRAIYHSPDWLGIPSLPRRWRTVVTIHDLIPLIASEWVPKSLKARHQTIYRAALRAIVDRASAVLTDTLPWSLEIQKHLGVPERRLHIVPLGVAPPKHRTADQLRRTCRRFGLGDQPYVITVGRWEPYKGLGDVIRAFGRARRDERLVVVGPRNPRYTEDIEEVRRLNLEPHVVFTDTVSPEDLDCLYGNARAFITMSRFEGFGLCPLEAMARGIPVLAGRTSVSEYTVETAALVVEPDDEMAAAGALRRLLDDEELRFRLVHAGRARAAGFAWETTARATADVYRKVLLEHSPSRSLAALRSPPDPG